jgi:predicted RNA-binding protein with PIN domain
VAAGLRRELALPVSSLRPADTVDALEPGGSAGSGRPRDDPALLDDLLALPRAHLVVDGYNVTKSVWPSMPLEAQRTRLVQGLAALVARTGAEVTCVFDGADVSVPSAVIPGQGVRVRFSARGQTADDLILRMIAAEPSGRPVIVVSSDREVADGVRRQGARALETPALVGLLAG